MYEFGDKVLLLPLAPARRGDFGPGFGFGIYLGCRSFDGQAYIGTLSGVIRCRTVRQLSAEERWDKEFVLSIKGTPSPDGGVPEMSTSVWISLRLEATGERIRQILTHQFIPRGMPFTSEMFERFGIIAQCLGCVPFGQELGTLQTSLSAVVKGLSTNSRRSQKELTRSLATERENQAGERHESRGP